MFKDRAIQMRFVKTHAPSEAPTDFDDLRPTLDPELINTLLKDQVRHIAITVVAATAAVTVLHTLSEIAINNTKPKN